MRLLPIVLFATLLAFPAAAQDRPSLTDGQVSAFVKSWPEVMELGQRYASNAPKRQGQGAVAPGPQGAMTSRIEAMRAAGAHPELQALVKQHGFADVNQWTDVATRVTTVFAYGRQGSGGDLAANMARVRQQIESNSRLSPEQKQQALEQIAAAERSLEQSRPSDADRKAVEPHLGEIEAMMRPAQRPRR